MSLLVRRNVLAVEGRRAKIFILLWYAGFFAIVWGVVSLGKFLTSLEIVSEELAGWISWLVYFGILIAVFLPSSYFYLKIREHLNSKYQLKK